MRWTFILLLLGSVCFADERPKLIVLDFVAAGGTDAAVARSLSEAVTAEVSRRGFFQVMSSQDVQTLLGVERQRQLMGCSDDAASCVSELAGALGAQFVLSGSVTRFGETFQLNLQTLDSVKAQPIGRTTRLSRSLDALRGQVPIAVAEATGTPLPPGPSRVLPYGLLGGGALLVVGSGALGVLAVNDDAALTRELSAARATGVVPRTATEYQREASDIGLRRTLSLLGMAAGALVMGSGAWLLRSEDQSAAVSMMLTGSGVAVVGVLP